MKKFTLFTTALAAILASATVSAAHPAPLRESYSPLAQTATAALTAAETAPEVPAEETIYPEDFTSEITFSTLTDYAVNGDVFSFAEGTVIKTVETDELGDRKMTPHDCGFEIKHLDYQDGKLYLGNAEGKTYVYPDLSNTVTYDFKYYNRLSVGENEYLYLLSSDGKLTCYDPENHLYEFGEGYSLLKVYNDVAYTVKDNVLYSISGETITPVKLGFTDFSTADSISVAGAKQALLADYTVNTVTVKSGAYCTEIDLTDLSGKYFKQVKTVKLSGVKSALELCKSGNASIIAMNDGDATKAYLTLTSSLESNIYKSPESDLTDAFTLQEVKLYSVPYMCGASVITVLPQRAVVKVEEKFSLTFIDTEFYKVSYKYENGETVKGYVAKGFLSPYTFSAEQNKTENLKDDFKYENNVQTVVLVLIIVGLVIIAVVYLTIVGTKGKKSKNKKDAAPTITDDEN